MENEKPYRVPTILYAEDNFLLMHIVKDVLSLAGWLVEHSSDGYCIRALLENPRPYDLILLANELRYLNGLELTKLTRRLPHRAHTPIILISLEDLRQEALEAGANKFLQKPNDLLRLVETVRHLIAASADK